MAEETSLQPQGAESAELEHVLELRVEQTLQETAEYRKLLANLEFQVTSLRDELDKLGADTAAVGAKRDAARRELVLARERRTAARIAREDVEGIVEAAAKNTRRKVARLKADILAVNAEVDELGRSNRRRADELDDMKRRLASAPRRKEVASEPREPMRNVADKFRPMRDKPVAEEPRAEPTEPVAEEPEPMEPVADEVELKPTGEEPDANEVEREQPVADESHAEPMQKEPATGEPLAERESADAPNANEEPHEPPMREKPEPQPVEPSTHSEALRPVDENAGRAPCTRHEVITLRVADRSAETFYRVKRAHPLKRLLRAHASKKGLKPSALRLTYNNKFVDSNLSANDLRLPDLALLVCALRPVLRADATPQQQQQPQQPGSLPAARILSCDTGQGAFGVEEDPDSIVVTVRNAQDASVDAYYSLRTLSRLDQLFRAHAKHLNVPVSDLAFFTCSGQRHLRESQTALEVGLADLAQVVCIRRTRRSSSKKE